MKILSIGKTLYHAKLNIISIDLASFLSQQNIETFDYIIINGGDGAIRRVLKQIHHLKNLPPFILNPTGSFNVIAKMHHVPNVEKVLDSLAKQETPHTTPQEIYALNNEIFLFSAGNMGDLQHIFLSETLRFGVLKKGIAKYLLAGLFLLPVHLIMTPFMLLSPRRFFVFTPASFIGKFGSFYGRVPDTITIDLENDYNLIELDGDVVTVEESVLKIAPIRYIEIVI